MSAAGSQCSQHESLRGRIVRHAALLCVLTICDVCRSFALTTASARRPKSFRSNARRLSVIARQRGGLHGFAFYKPNFIRHVLYDWSSASHRVTMILTIRSLSSCHRSLNIKLLFFFIAAQLCSASRLSYRNNYPDRLMCYFK